ncbi:hypothetical protein [Roseobacter sp. A03A-229]
MRLPFQAPPTVLIVLVVLAVLISTKLAEADTTAQPTHSCAQAVQTAPIK